MKANTKNKKETDKKGVIRKWRWIFHVVLAAILLIAFLILLMNSFGNRKEIALASETSVNRYRQFVEIWNINSNQTVQGITKMVSEIVTPVTLLHCTKLNNDSCYLKCTADIGPLLNEFLTEEYRECKESLNLVLENCNFPDRTITPLIFDGTYHLKTLTVTNCNFVSIASETFKQSPLVNLIELHFYNNNIEQLPPDTFIGLITLKIFKMQNNETEFNGNDFLKPLAETLEVVQIRQDTRKKQLNPKDWFGNIEFYKLLSVNLDGNFFPTILDKDVFQHMKSVQNLSLQDCSITQIGEGTFESIAGTLQYLDLRKNNLKKLNAHFLSAVPMHILRLELAENPWSCGCDNYDLVAIYQQKLVTFTDIPKCASPPEWINTNMDCSCIYCKEQTTEPSTSDKSTIELETTTEMQETTKFESTEEYTTICTSMPSFHTTSEITPSMYPPTTDPPSEKINCISYSIGNTLIPFYKSKIFFIIETSTSTSVNISIKNVSEHLTLLYFNKTHSGRQYCDHNCLVTDLIAMKCYTFCLVRNKDISTSAFSCHSHQLNLREETPVTPVEYSKALFWTIFSFGIPFCILIGGVIIYFVLRWRPIWLRGNKRLVRTSPTSQTVFLYSNNQKTDDQIESRQNSLNSETSSFASFSRNRISSSPDLQRVNQGRSLPAVYEVME